MARPEKDRTWWIVAAVFVIALHFVVVCWARVAGELRLDLADYFFLPTSRSDRAIELYKDERLFALYCLATPVILALAPILVQRVKWPAWVGFVVVLALYTPGYFYGREILYLSGKMIDWSRVLDGATDQPKGENTPEHSDSTRASD